MCDMGKGVYEQACTDTVLLWVPPGCGCRSRAWSVSIISGLVVQFMDYHALPLIMSCLMLHRAGLYIQGCYAMGGCGSYLYPQGLFIMR